jgi:hypothetical protein
MVESDTKRGKVRFTVKESGDGTPWIMIEPDEHLKFPMRHSDYFFGFELRPNASYDEAKKIATYLNRNIETLTCTFFERQKTLEELLASANSDGELDAQSILKHYQFGYFKDEFLQKFLQESDINFPVSVYWLCQHYLGQSGRSIVYQVGTLSEIDKLNYAVKWYKGFIKIAEPSLK